VKIEKHIIIKKQLIEKREEFALPRSNAAVSSRCVEFKVAGA
jgi:hypothetical protein